MKSNCEFLMNDSDSALVLSVGLMQSMTSCRVCVDVSNTIAIVIALELLLSRGSKVAKVSLRGCASDWSRKMKCRNSGKSILKDGSQLCDSKMKWPNASRQCRMLEWKSRETMKLLLVPQRWRSWYRPCTIQLTIQQLACSASDASEGDLRRSSVALKTIDGRGCWCLHKFRH